MSFAVIREALLRLEGESLVTLVPNHGFRVTPVTLDSLREITDVRVLLEGEALRLSVESGDVDWESRVIAAYYRLACAPQRGDDGLVSYAWQTAHDAFHDALGSGCGNTLVRRMAAELYRQLSLRSARSASRDIDGGHREIMGIALGGGSSMLSPPSLATCGPRQRCSSTGASRTDRLEGGCCAD